jgi:hypothetical protein
VILVDSSVWIGFLRGTATREVVRLRRALEEDDAAIGDLVLSELLRGTRDDVGARRLSERLAALPCHDLVGRTVAIRAAANYRALRRRGITIRKDVDLLIGAWCIEHEVPLLHADRDFDPMAEHLGLRVP